MELENTINLKDAKANQDQNFGEEYTNPEDDKSLSNNQANTPKDDSFKPICRFIEEKQTHLISLGIKLSQNHPVIKDSSFLTEIQEKIKGLTLSSDRSSATI